MIKLWPYWSTIHLILVDLCLTKNIWKTFWQLLKNIVFQSLLMRSMHILCLKDLQRNMFQWLNWAPMFLSWAVEDSPSVGWYQVHILGVKVRNMKMDFNTRDTWRGVGQWPLMMKINEFFYSAKSFNHPHIILCKKSSIFAVIFAQYYTGKRLSRIKKIINFHH